MKARAGLGIAVFLVGVGLGTVANQGDTQYVDKIKEVRIPVTDITTVTAQPKTPGIDQDCIKLAELAVKLRETVGQISSSEALMSGLINDIALGQRNNTELSDKLKTINEQNLTGWANVSEITYEISQLEGKC